MMLCRMFCGPGDGTQGLVHARQELYHGAIPQLYVRVLLYRLYFGEIKSVWIFFCGLSPHLSLGCP
jgi:hypothetical protein